MQRHYASIAQVLQGISNPTMPPELKQYLVGTIGGMAYVMSKLLRAFGYDDVYRMQPELEVLKQLRSSQNGQQPDQRTSPQTNGNGQEFQPFHKLMEKKGLYKDLRNHPGYKVLETYLEELLSQYKNSLIYEFQNIKDRDISDIIRGKIMILNELINLDKAIDGMIDLRRQWQRIRIINLIVIFVVLKMSQV